MPDDEQRRTLSNLLAARLVPHRFLADEDVAEVIRKLDHRCLGTKRIGACDRV